MRDNAPLAEQCGVDAPARSIYKPPVAERYRSAIEFTPSRASASFKPCDVRGRVLRESNGEYKIG